METLRHLLVQRAARLQDRPALSCKAWGTLNYSQFRNRVEGVALGLMATSQSIGTLYYTGERGEANNIHDHAEIDIQRPTYEPWIWIAEVAAIACGFIWSSQGDLISPSILGGRHFNNEEGRGPFHDRDAELTGSCFAVPGLSHQQILLRMQRENEKLGWDHTTKLELSQPDVTTSNGRALLWNALYAGSHVVLTEPIGSSFLESLFLNKRSDPVSAKALDNFWLT